MKNFKKTLITSLLLLTTGALFSGCNSGTSSQQADKNSPSTVLKIGASPVPHAEILETVKPLLEKEGIQLEIQVFTDYVLPNTALDSGDLDANFFQHQPYLDSFNENNGTKIVSVAPIHFEPLGIYPGKSNDLSSIQKGAVIAVPNDITNEARALQLLESLELITLDPSKGLESTIHDITSNPYEITFKELEAATIPRALDDVDFAVVNGNYALDSGIAESVLASEQADSEGAKTFANIIATTEEKVKDPSIQKLIDALQSEEIKTFITDSYNGVVVPSF